VLKLYRNTREPGSAMQALAQRCGARFTGARPLGAHDPYIPALMRGGSKKLSARRSRRPREQRHGLCG